MQVRHYPAGSSNPEAQELWQSDGTVAGTTRVFRSGPPNFDRGFMNAAAAGGVVYFSHDDGTHGKDLWGAPRQGVIGRHVFYDNSTFDNYDRGAGPADDGAVATDKDALLPGQSANFSNVTSYTRGINGVMIDVGGDLPLTSLAGIAAGIEYKVGAGGDPATWTDAPARPLIGIRKGAGMLGADRITLTWPDGVIRNAWLRVTVPAAPAFGLPRPDLFNFGNLVGETGDAVAAFAVGPADVLAARRAAGAGAGRVGVESPHDFNRDGRVNAIDQALVRLAQSRSLTPVTTTLVAALPDPDARRRAAGVRSRYTSATQSLRHATTDQP